MWCSGISACLRHRSVPAPHAGAAQACEFFVEDQRLRRHPAGYSLPRCSVAGTLRAGTGCSRGRTMHRLRHRFSEQALGSGGHERRTRLRGRMDRHRTTQAAERGRGHVSWDTSQAARCPRAASTLREFDINIEGRHRPAVASNHWNRRMRRGAGRASPCPTFVVGRAPTFTRPGDEPVVTIHPKCRPPRSDKAFFATFYRGGLHFGRSLDFRPPSTAKPSHALARPGHCLVRLRPSRRLPPS